MCITDLLTALQLYAFLNHLGFIADPFQTTAFSTPLARFQLRMKPFIDIDDPPCPELDVIQNLVTLRHDGDSVVSKDMNAVLQADQASQALGILSVSIEELSKAKTEWMSASKKGTLNSSESTAIRWSKSDVQDTTKACIAANVAAAEARKGIENREKAVLLDCFQVSIPKHEDVHHPWWIVPKITAKKME